MTQTQRIILLAAARCRRGLVIMGHPDRRGTRIVGYTSDRVPIVVAYCAPEFFLCSRKLLAKHNPGAYTYHITAAGRDAIRRFRCG